jgi:hypothetical protein
VIAANDNGTAAMDDVAQQTEAAPDVASSCASAAAGDADSEDKDVSSSVDTCSICTDAVSQGEIVESARLDTTPGACASLIRLPCRHLFHVGCLENWFKLGNSKCPNCNCRPIATTIYASAFKGAAGPAAAAAAAAAAASASFSLNIPEPMSAQSLCAWLSRFTSVGVQTDGQMLIHWEPLTLPGTGSRPAAVDPDSSASASASSSASSAAASSDDNLEPTFGPAHNDIGSFVLHWKFPTARQDWRHNVETIGGRIAGRNYTSYLPACSKGTYILQLMKQAFIERKLFHVGQSLSPGAAAASASTTVSVTYGSVHHRSSRVGGDAFHGYPSANYLVFVQDDLEVILGIRKP